MNIFVGYFFKNSTYGVALSLSKTRNDLNMFFSLDTTRSQIFFLEKNFIGIKFIAIILEVRKDNEEICSILWYRKTRKLEKKKYACRIHIIDVISIALFLPLVISLDITLLTAKISGANVSMHQTNSGKPPKIRFPSYFHVL